MIRPSIDPLVVAILVPPHASSFMHFHFSSLRHLRSLHLRSLHLVLLHLRLLHLRSLRSLPIGRALQTGGQNAVSHQIEQVVEMRYSFPQFAPHCQLL
jgi:hypothetical protein